MKKKNITSGTSFLMDKLADNARLDQAQVLSNLRTSLNGLDSPEAARRLDEYGLNQIASEKSTPWFIQLIQAFINPFSGIMLFLAIISFVTGVALAAPGTKDWRTVIVIGAIVLISGTLHFVQEFRSSKAAAKLKALVHTTVAVVRNGDEKQEIEMVKIVPGDIIHLAAGDIIPADVRVLSSHDLFVGQSSLTGEAEPVEKYDEWKQTGAEGESVGLSDLSDLCFMGTTVVSGSAVAVVISTGSGTYFGSMAKTIVGKRELTS
ncbi:MAG: HAD-IC family P-type ATPase, partial [Petrimonas sp.]|nr:HAD-IC family P-type ATPase [Petrimonas sp.]